MRAIVPLLLSTLFLPALSAQDTAKDVYDNLMEAQKTAAAGPREERAKAMAELPKLAKAALADNEKILSEGDGLYYRARIQMLMRDDPKNATALASLQAHIAAAPASDLAHESRLIAAQLMQRDDPAAAGKLLAAVKVDVLNDGSRRVFESVQKGLRATETRWKLTGKVAPAIPALNVLGAPSEWSLDQYKGKVVLIDFWATWCGPCRNVIPDLVKMQTAHGKDGLQVVGVTRFYGYGSDFTAESKLPDGGKAVGDPRDPEKKLTKEAEIAVNENFVKAFALNYPIVFTGDDVAGTHYGVQGIPTLIVIGRDGKVVGHAVGASPDTHAAIEKMVTQALAATATTDAAAHKSGK